MNKTKFKRLYISDIAELSTTDLFLYKFQNIAQNWCKNVKTMFDINRSIKSVLNAWLQFVFTPLIPLILCITLFGARKSYKKQAEYVMVDGMHTFSEGWHHTNETVWWVNPKKFTRSYEEGCYEIL